MNELALVPVCCFNKELLASSMCGSVVVVDVVDCGGGVVSLQQLFTTTPMTVT